MTLPEASWRLPRHVRSAGRARAFLHRQAHTWQLADDTVQTALLLLSELVTNACRHARTPADRHIAVRAALLDGLLRVEVSDADAELPRPRRAAPEDESGRGLELVAALADSWGAHPRGERHIGKTVWFELKLPPALL